MYKRSCCSAITPETLTFPSNHIIFYSKSYSLESLNDKFSKTLDCLPQAIILATCFSVPSHFLNVSPIYNQAAVKAIHFIGNKSDILHPVFETLKLGNLWQLNLHSTEVETLTCYNAQETKTSPAPCCENIPISKSLTVFIDLMHVHVWE